MFLKTRSLADYTPVYPGAVYTPRNVVDENYSGVQITGESGTVPASVNSDGKYELYLDQVPLEQEGTVLTVGGAGRTLIPYGQVPTAGTIAVSFESGACEFHSSDAGGTVAATYRGRGTALTGSLMVVLQEELAATQGEVDDLSDALDAFSLPLSVANGGTGATTAAGARTALGAQAASDILTAIDGVSYSSNSLLVATGADTFDVIGMESHVVSLLQSANVAGAQAALSLTPGTNVQPYSVALTSIVNLTTLADRMIYTTAANTYAVTNLTFFGRQVAACVDEAGLRTLLNMSTADAVTFGSLTAGAVKSTGTKWQSIIASCATYLDGFSRNISSGGRDYGVSSSTSGHEAYYPITPTPGSVISGLKVHLYRASSGDQVQLELVRFTDAGGLGVISTLTTSGSGTTRESNSFSHTIVAEDNYYLRLVKSSGSSTTQVFSVRYQTTERPV
jgi:hypothetical protein